MTPGTLLQGRFEIERAASAGGMGLIFRALDRLEGVEVAVKVLRGDDPGDVERFEREAAILAELHHPGVVRYLAHGQTPPGERYLVMEWLEGEDLRQRLARQPLTAAESLTILRNVASALALAHARGLVHRDLKPSNLFLVGGSVERVRLLDFGVARALRRADLVSVTGTLVGTPGYMAPEQALGLTVRNARSDVFSLGCVLFECLTGRRAFRGADIVAVLAKTQLEEAPSVRDLRPDLPASLAEVVSRMLARDPDARFRDAADVVIAIDALGDFSGADATPEGRPTSSIDLTALTRAPPTVALTLNEQRVVTVVLASAPDSPGPSAARARAAADVERYGGHLAALRDGVMLVTTWGAGGVADRAIAACLCALCLREHFPGVSVCVVTGRGKVSARSVEGRVIDGGALALSTTPSGTVRLDATTAAMVDARFLFDGGDHQGSRFLRGERDSHQATTSLLGKPTSFIGRDRELALLQAELAGRIDDRSAGAVLVLGEAGSGKSRLSRELIEKLGRRSEPIEVLVGRADSLGARSPFGPLVDAIRHAAGIHAGELVESSREKLTARLGRHLAGESLARVTAFLGEMAGVPFPDAAAAPLRAARGNAHLMGDAMRAAWEEWLAQECAAVPMLLVLEDLHWGDVATIKLVDTTLRNLRDLPLMVLVLARPEIHTRFFSLWAGRGVHEIRLGPLGRKACVQIVCEALGKGAAMDLVARVVEHANGNPFYLEELVRAVAAGRGEAFPDSVLGTVEARLDGEGVQAKRILRAASVFGERFSLRGVAALLGGDPPVEELRGRLDRLVARELVVEPIPSSRTGDASYAFCHALVREAVYATLTEDDRALGHRLAGAWHEANSSTDAVALAEHFARGGEPARAVRWYLRGAEQALAADDLVAAMERVGRGFACGASGEERGALLLVEAEAHLWRGKLALAEQRSLGACALFAKGSEGWFRSLYQAVVAAGKLGHFDRVEESFASAGATGALAGALGARIAYLCACASNLIFGGRYVAADAAFAALDPLTPSDPLSAALIHQSRSFRASARGDSGACLEGLEATFAAFEQAGDRRNGCTTRVNLGFILAELGDLEAAERALRAALTTADRMGLRDVAALARTNLGYVLGCRGQLDEARALERQAIEAHHRQQAARDEGLSRTYLAQIELRAGESTAAEREARAAAEVLLTLPATRAGALAVLARALLAQHRSDEALIEARAAYAELTALGSLEEGEALVRLAYAEALAAAGEASERTGVLAEARARLLDRASKISDLRWRERFLTGVPENARTLSLDVAAPT